MAQIVIMPKEGITVESCIVGAWRKVVGEQVQTDDVLFEYETDKATFECVSTATGVLLHKFFRQGDEAPVLAPVAVVGEAGEDVSALIRGGVQPDGENAEGKEPGPKPAAPEPVFEESAQHSPDRLVASPRARGFAEAQGVDLSKAIPSGPNNRILEADVIAAANKAYAAPELAAGSPAPQAPIPEPIAEIPARQAPISMPIPEPIAEIPAQPAPMPEPAAERPVPQAPIPEPALAVESPAPQAMPGPGEPVQVQRINPDPGGTLYEDVAFSKIRTVIGKAMMASLQRSAQLTHHHSFDATNVLAMREDFKAGDEAPGYSGVSVGDIILYVTSRVLVKYPEINALVADTGIRKFYTVNLGVAVDTPRGLMVPTVFGAEKKSLREISSEVSALAAAAREGGISPDKLKGGTFTVSNLGATGVEMFTPIINPPQAAIAGICGVTERVRKGRGGRLELYPSIGVSLSYDHRAVDGAPASRFAAELCDALAEFSWKTLARELENEEMRDRR